MAGRLVLFVKEESFVSLLEKKMDEKQSERDLQGEKNEKETGPRLHTARVPYLSDSLELLN